jgi:glycerol transport system ATP-binding protein
LLEKPIWIRVCKGGIVATIELKKISHSYMLGHSEDLPRDQPLDENFVIKELDLVWKDGTASALLGPSGCGKTTILNIISGLSRPTMGEVLFDGKEVSALPARERHIAQVFQFPVVYDTISVFKNLIFPLQNAGIPKKEARERVEEISEILDLGHILGLSAGKISQAEKQKVSLGRGLVRKDTAAILFDEPLTVIDPKEKYVLRRKLREVQRRLKISMIYVTHDQHEALTFADSVTVMKDGEVIQTGTPEQLHAEPESPFIGYFIGSPGMNLLNFTLNEENSRLDFGEFSIPIDAGMRSVLSGKGERFTLGIRPEFIKVDIKQKEGWPRWDVTLVEKTGSYNILTLQSNEIQIKARAEEDLVPEKGSHIWTKFPVNKMKIFNGEKRIF